MKIYFIPSSYPDASCMTRNIFIYEQAKALSKLGHDIVVLQVQEQPSRDIIKSVDSRIIFTDDGFAQRFTLKMHTFCAKKFQRLNGKHFTNKMITLFEYVLQKKGKPDVLYAHFSLYAGYAAVMIKRKYSIPVMTLEHYSGLMCGCLSGYQINVLKTVVEGSDMFACVSNNLKNSVKKFTATNKDIVVIPNMIDDMFDYTDPPFNHVFKFFALGRLTTQKNYPMLISAFCKAFKKDEPVQLLIAGVGELKSKIKKQVTENDREAQILLLGELTRSEILEQYQQCDCFAMASSWETFGIVWREAMAVGRPVITTDHGGFDVFKSEWGIMVPVNDVGGFSIAMNKVYLNIHKYNGKTISQDCINVYGSSLIARKIESFLMFIIGEQL